MKALKISIITLNGLVNAAGAIYFNKEQTNEGFEKSFALNYLIHFSLPKHLMNLLQKTKDSRVLIIGSAPMHLKNPKINFGDFQFVKPEKLGFICKLYHLVSFYEQGRRNSKYNSRKSI
ncbi:hypothetical protein ABIB40_003872 [Pedobacter sp. UYP30]|uniref:hypothetical protein n=1 Tax=Pedobacter sp. UYP30 TaxID=1756400 RepID=UPI003398F9B1